MHRSNYRARAGVSLFTLILAALVISAGSYGLYRWKNTDSGVSEAASMILHQVARGSFDHIVLDQGEIESSSNIEVVCQVKAKGGGGTPIIWVLEEGTPVKKGDLIVQLDKSALEDDVQIQRIAVNGAIAKLISSKALLETSQIARVEYLEGTFLTEERLILSETAVAEQDLRKAQLAASSTERLVAKGLVKSLQQEADQYAVANAQNKLESAQARLKVLRDLTKKKMLVQYDSEIEKSKALVNSDQSIHDEEQSKLDDLNRQVAACDIYAPADGVCVYSNRYSSRGGSAEFVVEAGAVVRELQPIVKLPDPSRMQVKAKISEGRITLVQDGMPVRIRVDAIPGLELLGRVTKVNRYAESGGYFGSQIKEYAAFIQIINPPSEIRTGMTAEVRIFVDQRPDVIQVPVQGLYEHDSKTFCLVKKGLDYETRLVSISATNDTSAAIENGLEASETIVLDLRNHLDLMKLPALDPAKKESGGSLSEQVLAQGGPMPAKIEKGGPSGRGENQGRDKSKGGGDKKGGDKKGGGEKKGGFNPAQVVTQTFVDFDTDKDGKISAEEIAAVPEERRTRLQASDANKDGAITRQELTTAMQAVMQRINAGGGGAPGGPGAGGQ